MTQHNSHSNILPPRLRINNAVEKLSRVQAEIVSEARRQAVDDVGAAMAHQLNEPLTALLLHLHAIKQASERSDDTQTAPASVCEIVDMALRETERICEILHRADPSVETPVDAETAIARGREAIDLLVRNSHGGAAGSVPPAAPVVSGHALTPREQQVLALVTSGASNKEGGHRLGISTRTFEAHRAHLMAKLGARNAADLVRVALATFNDAQSRLIGIED